jgi:alpha-glucosidase
MTLFLNTIHLNEVNQRFMKKYLVARVLFVLLTGFTLTAQAQKSNNWQLPSPDKKITITITAAPNLSWSVQHEQTSVLAPSPISVSLAGGEVLGRNISVAGTKRTSVNTTIATPLYKKSSITDQYNQLAINCKNGYSILFRAYNDGVAYRFTTNRKDSLVINREEATFNFDKDYHSFIPYIREPRYNGDPFQTSFEALYDEKKFSEHNKDTLGMLPLLVQLEDGKKAVLLEADLENYPGMYMRLNTQIPNSLQAVHAPYPVTEQVIQRNYIVTGRANYIARTGGAFNFPWRALVISTSDQQLANNDMVYKLAAPSRISDISWIKPGKVAWDWWNDWNISHVDFKAGINTPTYKYYIDFAAAHHVEYIVMDEGWSLNNDITKISPAINLQEIIDYGKQKNVGVILWATWYALHDKLDDVFAQYATMGVKGFKIDFLDRDDQKMVASTYAIAQKGAAHKLLIDLHGMWKPTGLQRTYPNVIGFEGVRGMENVKWAPNDDVPRYDVTIPFIRQMAGAMDYTPGAMRNANKGNFKPVYANPMSQGTRCHQLAMYVVFEAPLGMLSDNPTAYMREPDCTKFIAAVPTTFDTTIALDGKLGDYISIARRKGDTWYAGAMTNWTNRELVIDCSFLGDGNYEAEIFKDGINADRDATDYTREVITVTKNDKQTITLAPGGGWAARIYPKK